MKGWLSESAQALDLVTALEIPDLFYNKSRASEHNDPRKLVEQAPNISLNVSGATLSMTELWFWAIIGLVLQIAALVVPGLTVYLWKWQKVGEDTAAYGYPCFVSGSLAITFGILGCSYVIEKKTEETTYGSTSGCVSHIMRVQKAGTVGDQHFQSYAIMNDESNVTIWTSRLKVEHGHPWR